MTIASLIFTANTVDDVVLVNDLMSEAVDACVSSVIWQDEHTEWHGKYVFADGSTLYVHPCEVIVDGIAV